MGCSNSHLRPLFQHCRRKRSKKEEATLSPKNDVIDRNGSAGDILSVSLLGASLRNNTSNSMSSITTTLCNSKITDPSPQSDPSSSSPFCVPLLAQSEASGSQLDFFRMLDQKIEEGPDYESDSENDGLANHRYNLPSQSSERKPMLSNTNSKSGSKYSSGVATRNHRSSLKNKFSNWNWDEEGD